MIAWGDDWFKRINAAAQQGAMSLNVGGRLDDGIVEMLNGLGYSVLGGSSSRGIIHTIDWNKPIS